jgi:hypothetical protein
MLADDLIFRNPKLQVTKRDAAANSVDNICLLAVQKKKFRIFKGTSAVLVLILLYKLIYSSNLGYGPVRIRKEEGLSITFRVVRGD